MTLTATVLTILLALVMAFAAVGKLAGLEQAMAGIRSIGFPEDKVWLLAVIDFAGAAGLVIGIVVTPLAIAAAIGVALYFAGAVLGHLRAKDGQFGPALALGLLAIATVVTNVIAG